MLSVGDIIEYSRKGILDEMLNKMNISHKEALDTCMGLVDMLDIEYSKLVDDYSDLRDMLDQMEHGASTYEDRLEQDFKITEDELAEEIESRDAEIVVLKDTLDDKEEIIAELQMEIDSLQGMFELESHTLRRRDS